MTTLFQQINLIANAMVVATALSLSACAEQTEDSNQTEEQVQVNTAVSTSVPDGNIAQLQREAQEGDPDAQYNLAYIYENGLGVPKDESKALELYKQAANQGHPAAQTNLDALSKSK
jgi:TPR repeat protein